MVDYGPLLDMIRGLHWPARRPVPAGPTGTHHSRMRGVSAEFTEYRNYRQGDDPRRLDWKLLARSDHAFIRLATDRAILPATIVVDASASMAFPTATLAKWHTARRLAVGLAAVAHADGDPVGLVVPAAGGVRRLPPRTRRGVVAEVARTLDGVEPGGSASVGAALGGGPAHARVAVVSDFLGDEEGILRGARQWLAAGGEAHAVHVVAREELEPAELGILATDPEDASVRRPLVEASRAEYVAAFAAWRERLARLWRDAGGSYTMVVTDEPVERAVRRVVAPQRSVPAGSA
jgi:uncharacterized protein (DUF58 family)